MAPRDGAFGTTARLLLLLIVAGVIAVVVVAVVSARETSTPERGSMGSLGAELRGRTAPAKVP